MVTATKKACYSISMVAIVVMAFAASLAPVQSAYAQTDTSSKTLLIQFKPEITETDRLATVSAIGAELVDWMPEINVAVVRMGASQRGAVSLLNSAQVNFVEEDGVVMGTLDIADPSYNDPALGYGQSLIQLGKGWDISTGSTSVIVAVLDTGINRLHPEFVGRVMAGTDIINGDSNPNDDHGHGTHVAGIIAAAINGQGSAGVCPACKIMPVKVLDATNTGSWRSVSRGILYAVNHGARVINLSLGGFLSSDTLESAIQYAHAHNVVVVAAAGNGATSDPFYPAALDNVIAVSAVGPNDEFWSLSDFGDYIDVAAPGVGILSTYHDPNFGGGYAIMSGTSMATPFVSGLVGLMISVDPALDPDKTVELLQANADDRGDAGFDPYFGYGRINVHKTIDATYDRIVVTDAPAPVGASAVALFMPLVRSTK